MTKLFSTIILVIACQPLTAWAAPCIADVENEGARLSGHVFYTTWHVRHDAGRDRSATVSFEYKIHYRNQRGATLTESRFFNEYIKGSGKQLTTQTTSSNDPVEILFVDFDRVACRA